MMKLHEWVANNNQNLSTIKLFRLFLYVWFLIYYNTLAFNVDFFWGENNFIPLSTTHFFFANSFLNLFKYELVARNPIILIFALDMIILLNFKWTKSRSLPFLIYFLTLSLDSRSYYVLDGGNNLVSILTVFNIFFRVESDGEGVINSFSSSISNLTLLMAKIQICIVYFVAGHAKLQGELWSNGTALYYTLSVAEMSLATVRDFVKVAHPVFLVLPTYTVLVFQLSFPFLVWNKNFKRFLLPLGMAIHLGISLVMGLTFFGYALCVSYLLFYEEQQAKKILSSFQGWKDTFLDVLYLKAKIL